MPGEEHLPQLESGMHLRIRPLPHLLELYAPREWEPPLAPEAPTFAPGEWTPPPEFIPDPEDYRGYLILRRETCDEADCERCASGEHHGPFWYAYSLGVDGWYTEYYASEGAALQPFYRERFDVSEEEERAFREAWIEKHGREKAAVAEE